MKIDKHGLHFLRGPKEVGGFLIIENPTPEVEELLKAMSEFKFNEGGINFRMICKPAQTFEDFDGRVGEGTFASVGWKLKLVDRTATLEERVKGIQ